jgi:hypothetical protein
MMELDSEVVEFNLHVNAQIKALSHRCKAANDVELADLIRRKENKYEEGKDVNVKCSWWTC